MGKVISISNSDTVLVGEMEVVHISWSEAPHDGHVQITDEAGKVLAAMTAKITTLSFTAPLRTDFLRFSGLTQGILQVYLSGASSSGY